jgi:hypothetical protein
MIIIWNIIEGVETQAPKSIEKVLALDKGA